MQNRVRSIENSNPNLPISLLIVSRINEQDVIGHAKITRLPLNPNSCWIESGNTRNIDPYSDKLSKSYYFHE